MHPAQEPQVDTVQADDTGRPAASPGSAGPRRRRRAVTLTVAVVAPVLLIAAGAVSYVAGAWNDDGKFRAEPSACAAVTPSMPLLGAPYTARQGEANNCDLLLPAEHPRYIPHPVMSVSFAVVRPRRADAPQAASKILREVRSAYQPLPGIGDEAYTPADGGPVYLRVSNLVMGIAVFPAAASSDEQVHAFAADVAKRLRES